MASESKKLNKTITLNNWITIEKERKEDEKKKRKRNGEKVLQSRTKKNWRTKKRNGTNGVKEEDGVMRMKLEERERSERKRSENERERRWRREGKKRWDQQLIISWFNRIIFFLLLPPSPPPPPHRVYHHILMRPSAEHKLPFCFLNFFFVCFQSTA